MDIYICFCLSGLKGEQGLMGVPGRMGYQGERGPDGPKGNIGPTGEFQHLMSQDTNTKEGNPVLHKSLTSQAVLWFGTFPLLCPFSSWFFPQGSPGNLAARALCHSPSQSQQTEAVRVPRASEGRRARAGTRDLRDHLGIQVGHSNIPYKRKHVVSMQHTHPQIELL